MPAPVSIVLKMADIVKSAAHQADDEYLFEDILAYLYASLPHLIAFLRRVNQPKAVDGFWDQVSADLTTLIPRSRLSRAKIETRVHLVSCLVGYCRSMTVHCLPLSEAGFLCHLDIIEYGGRNSFLARWRDEDLWYTKLGDYVRSLAHVPAESMSEAG